MTDNENRLQRVIGSVFGIAAGTVNDSTSVDTVEKWDSLHHLNLVLALEEEFKVSLTEEQSVQILSYPLIKAVLGEHGVQFDR